MCNIVVLKLRGNMAVNSEPSDWGYAESDEERAPLIGVPHAEPKPTRGRTSPYGAVFIVVNAALGAGLLNFPAAFYMAGGVVAGVALQMVRHTRAHTHTDVAGEGHASFRTQEWYELSPMFLVLLQCLLIFIITGLVILAYCSQVSCFSLL